MISTFTHAHAKPRWILSKLNAVASRNWHARILMGLGGNHEERKAREGQGILSNQGRSAVFARFAIFVVNFPSLSLSK